MKQSEMPYNLLLLPVIIGYFILTHSYFFKYNAQRLTPNRIVFESISVAIIILVIGFLLRVFVHIHYPHWIEILIFYLEFLPLQKVDYLWTVLLSSFLTFILVFTSNFICRVLYKKSEWIGWAVDKHGDELEKLFKSAVIQGHLIQLIVKNDKVVIGFFETIPPPNKSVYLQLSPVFSGYINTRKEIILTTNYYRIVIKKDRSLGIKRIRNTTNCNTTVVLKRAEILSANVFDRQRYNVKYDSTLIK